MITTVEDQVDQYPQHIGHSSWLYTRPKKRVVQNTPSKIQFWSKGFPTLDTEAQLSNMPDFRQDTLISHI